MLSTIAEMIVILFGLWLIAVGVLMLARPRVALHALSKAASTNLINYGEITLRLIVGLALVEAAPVSESPGVFRIFGWFIVASSAALYLVPRTLHARYPLWWSKKLTPMMLRCLAPLSLAGGAFFTYAA